MEQSLDEAITVAVFQRPGRVLLDRANRSFIGMLNHEVRKREPFDAGGFLDARFLLREKPGFGPFCAAIGECHTCLVYGSPPYISILT